MPDDLYSLLNQQFNLFGQSSGFQISCLFKYLSNWAPFLRNQNLFKYYAGLNVV